MNRILVTGGAGFIGSALTRELHKMGHHVTVLDDLSTGKATNIPIGVHLNMETLRDEDEFDEIFHFASPASPDDFARRWDKIVEANVVLMMSALKHLRRGGLLVVAGSSEAYGQPGSHMTESCLGRVNTQSVRGVYDESKRLIEAMAYSASRRDGVRSLILRIFNTYGPGMPDDGRVINTFVRQAKAGHYLTVHGSGEQTRSFCYIDDLVLQILFLRGEALDEKDYCEVYNVGYPYASTVMDAALIVANETGVGIECVPSPRENDPTWRRPVLNKLWEKMGRMKYTKLEEGIKRCL